MRIRSIVLVTVLAATTACKKEADSPARPTGAATDRFAIAVTEQGFSPADLAVPMGKPVTLVFERKTDTTCAKEVVIQLDGQKIQKPLPLNTPVEIAVTFPKAGKLTYACGMDMVKATLTVQ